MFGLFRKKGEAETPLKKRIKDMKCRKISFVDCDLDELCAKMRQSPETLLTLTPVNYYAVKNEYILALIYTVPDYSENYVQLKRISYEKQTGQSEIYALDSVTVSKALAKVGIMIDLPKDREQP